MELTKEQAWELYDKGTIIIYDVLYWVVDKGFTRKEGFVDKTRLIFTGGSYFYRTYVESEGVPGAGVLRSTRGMAEVDRVERVEVNTVDWKSL